MKGCRDAPVIRGKHAQCHGNKTKTVSKVRHQIPDSINHANMAANEEALLRPKITWQGGEASSHHSLHTVRCKNIWTVAQLSLSCLPGHIIAQSLLTSYEAASVCLATSPDRWWWWRGGVKKRKKDSVEEKEREQD